LLSSGASNAHGLLAGSAAKPKRRDSLHAVRDYSDDSGEIGRGDRRRLGDDLDFRQALVVPPRFHARQWDDQIYRRFGPKTPGRTKTAMRRVLAMVMLVGAILIYTAQLLFSPHKPLKLRGLFSS
jgi:hypothetical protein